MPINKQNILSNSEKILIVADDLTGAVDTGVQFSMRHLKTIVVTGNEHLKESLKTCDVLVVDTESRFDETESAYRKAFETGYLARTENIKYFYKKLDSTMRGNVGAEISGLMDSLDISHTFVVPALPMYGRTTLNGNVYVSGVLLAETDYARDPKNPVKESFIPAIISRQTDKKTGVISFNDLLAGRQEFMKELHEIMNAGVQIIVIDAEDDEDIDLIASVLAEIEGRVMFAGCSGLAEKLAGHLDLKKEIQSSIVIAGSVNKVTMLQADYAVREFGFRITEIDTDKILNDHKSSEISRITNIVNEAVADGKDLIIRSAPSAEAVAKCFETGKKLGFDNFRVSDKIACFLGELSAEIVRKFSIKGIVLTGGDTAIKAMRSLNIHGIVIRDEILHGIPYGNFNDEMYKDIIVVTKAGGFGGEDALVQILNFLKNA